ncbi:aldo-keto reductase, partial [Tubulinosema ratisbonensis]
TVQLNNGRTMPLVGLGTWQIRKYDDVKLALNNAIDLGYRHIDTAFKYKNEKEIGEALKEIFESKKIKREDLFITTKLHQIFHKNVKEGLKRSLEALQLDYVDLYMIHWPVSFKLNPSSDYEMESDFDEKEHELDDYDVISLWKELEKLVESGQVKALGMCNHGIKNTELILKHCKIKPAVAQIEFHPYLQQPHLVDFYKNNGIAIMGHSCLAGGFNPGDKPRIMDDKVIKDVAKRNDMTVFQVILSYAVQNDIGVIPKAIEKNWQSENLKLKELSENDLKMLKSIDMNYRFSDHPLYGPERFS